MQARQSRLRVTATLGCVWAAWTFASPAFAVDIIDDPVQIDERAAQLYSTSNSLCWEMHRYHQQQPDYAQAYREAKEISARAVQLRDALRAGPVETEALMREVTQISDVFSRVETTLSKWGTGDLALVPPSGGGPAPRTVMAPGTVVNLPFIGVQVGGPRVVVTDDGPPQLVRRRLHPNSPGSKRSLERHLAAVKVAVNYLREDAGIAARPSSSAAGTPDGTGPTPESLAPDAALGAPQKVPATVKPNPTPANK